MGPGPLYHKYIIMDFANSSNDLLVIYDTLKNKVSKIFMYNFSSLWTPIGTESVINCVYHIQDEKVYIYFEKEQILGVINMKEKKKEINIISNTIKIKDESQLLLVGDHKIGL